jgi:hypothetical protein
MNSIEKNRLIATFMGYKHPLTDGLLATKYSDWNQLMPVVSKIDDLELKNGYTTFSVDIFRNGCQIFRFGDINQELITTESESRFEATYEAIVEFIILYNKGHFNE